MKTLVALMFLSSVLSIHVHAADCKKLSSVKTNAVIKNLGREIESACHDAWVQDFEGGTLIHLSQKQPAGAGKLESHDGSTFIIRNDETANKGQFLFQWRPPVSGIYDVDLFKSILESYPRASDLISWPKRSKLSESELVELFRAHTESSSQNLSGGLAVIYAMYRLDQVLGRPLGQMKRKSIFRRNFQNGYVVLGGPRAYVFKIESEPKGDMDTNKYAGGRKFRAGSWQTL